MKDPEHAVPFPNGFEVEVNISQLKCSIPRIRNLLAKVMPRKSKSLSPRRIKCK
jgi:hypothetical protein